MDPDAFQNTRPSTLDTLAQEQANRGAFGTNSIFYTASPCEEGSTEFHTGINDIDLEKLKDFIIGRSREPLAAPKRTAALPTNHLVCR